MTGGEIKEVSAEYRSVRQVDDCPVGYKRTEVGVVPEEWDVVDLESITIKVGSGKTPKGGANVYISYGRPLVRSQNVGWGKLKLNDIVYISEEVHETFLGSELRKGDVLLNITGASIGRSSIASEELSGGNVNQHVCIIRVDTKKIDSRLICRLILSYDGQSQIDSFQAGGNREGLNFTQVKALKFALSNSKQEQTAIANALSDVDTLIASLEKLITKKRAIKTAAMQQLLTGKKRLPPFDKTHTGYKQTELGEIPEDWEVRPIGATLSIRHGRDQKKVERQDGAYPILGTGGEMGRSDTYLYDKPSVLIGRKGTINKPAYMDSPFWTVDTLFYSEVDKRYSAKFIYYKFCMVDWLGYNEASGVPSLNASTIESVLQSFPEKKDEQVAIAGVLSDIDAELKKLDKRLNKTQQLKQGMMQELLTGRIRLVSPQGERSA